MHVFYLPEIDLNKLQLNDDEAHHATKVLRMQIGQHLLISSGKGQLLRASISTLGNKSCDLELVELKEIDKPEPQLHLAVAPTKNTERLEWFIEKATEIGISRITPLLCAHSERKFHKSERLVKVAVAALKQAQQAWLPQIDEAIPFSQFLKNDLPKQKFIAHCREGLKTPLHSSYEKGKDALLLIGPEGDFNEQEIQECLRNSFTAVSLGNSRLRTETAALVGLHTMALANQ